MAKTTKSNRPSGRPPKPRVCPNCLTPRPGWRPIKYPPPCPNCQSLAPPVKLSTLKPTQPKGDPSSVLPSEVIESPQESGKVDLKAEFTVKELNFLQIYLNGGVTIDDAMISAGYGGLEERNRYYTANRILRKHVEQAGDIKKVMRSVGVGEVQLALKIKQLLNDPAKTIQIRAVELAARILEMTREGIDLNTGIQIVIKKDGQVQVAGQEARTRPAALPVPGSPTGPRVRMIK